MADAIKVCNPSSYHSASHSHGRFLQVMLVHQQVWLDGGHTLHAQCFQNFDILNEANIILLTKKEGAEKIEDFKPINLIQCDAKLFLKLLSLRLVVENIVSMCSNQKWAGGPSGPEAGQSAVRTVRACGPDGPRVRRTYYGSEFCATVVSYIRGISSESVV
jgi:hypothetical protein